MARKKKKTSKKGLFIMGITLSFILVIIGLSLSTKPIDTFEECQKAGYPVLESFPRVCNINGKTFTEGTSDLSSCLLSGRCAPTNCHINGRKC